MTVKTHFTRDNFEGILAQYDLGELLDSKIIQQGTVQTNYLLETSRCRVVFRYYEVRSLESILFERDLIDYLGRNDYPCPSQIKNLGDKVLGTFQGRPYAIFEFIEGQQVTNPSVEQYQQLIQKAAELQNLSDGFSSSYTSQRWNYSPELCLKLAQKEAERINAPAGTKKLAWLERQLAGLVLPPTLPIGICHCDFHFSNVLFQGSEFKALLDFDDANLTYMGFDLVGLIESRAWPNSHATLDLKAAREVVREYMKYRLLPQIEKQHLYDVYQLSILLDCVWYFNRWQGDTFREKIKIEALEKCGRQMFFDGLF